MKWLFVLSTAVVSVLAATTTASAASFTCSGTITGATVSKVIVPKDGTCTLIGSTVTGDVSVGKNAYFEANATSIQGNLKGNAGLTIYTHDGSTIGGSVKASKTTQVFLFDGGVGKDVQAQSISGSGHVQVCGMTIGRNLQIQKAGTDILVGDSIAGCGGNTIGGDVKIMKNFTDVELDVQDNTIGGKLTVSQNTGPSDKLVIDNTGGTTLQCDGNSVPFVGGPNSGFATAKGQCTF